MSRREARAFRRMQAARFRSTFVPMPPDPTVDVDAIERKRPLHGYTSIFTGAIVAFALVFVIGGIGILAVMFA